MLAIGITLLQVAANPYVTILGKPETASSRLNLTQAFNSLGTTVAPYFGSLLILSNAVKTAKEVAEMSPAELEAYKAAEAAAVQYPFNYILGANVHNLSFVTGIGSKSPMKPHHRPSEADGVIQPIPGLLVGGPNQYLNDPILQQYFNQNTPPTLCYIDHLHSYASNEIAINWNAPLVFVSGFFNDALITSVEDNLNYLPETIELEQNYPNPFSISNSSVTKIKFTIGLMSNNKFNKKMDSKNLINQSDTENFSEPYLVKLVFYDILGREIITILDGYLQAERYEINLRSDIFRSRLSGGIYFYKLQVRNQALMKKMIVLN